MENGKLQKIMIKNSIFIGFLSSYGTTKPYKNGGKKWK